VYTAPSRPAGSPRTIAICIVIVDELYHEDIWKHWLSENESSASSSSSSAQSREYDARFYIHAKRPDRVSDWVRERLIPECFAPEWNSPEVVRAMLALLQNALIPDSTRGPRCVHERFIFATESCVPLFSLKEACERLFADEIDCSWVNAWHDAKSKWERQTFDAVNTAIIPREVWHALICLAVELCC
jgi:hypothetical protein